MQHEISFVSDVKALANYFPDAEVDGTYSKEIFPGWIAEPGSGMQPVVFLNPVTGMLAWRSMAWGCMPFDMADAVIPSKRWAFMLYTPGERIFGDTKSYWHKIRDQRCLVPVSGIYIHRKVRNWRHKVPYFVHIPDQPVFFLPGLYSVDAAIDVTTGRKVVCCAFTIIGRLADSLVQRLRAGEEKNKPMPLLLPFSLSRHWLDPDLSEADTAPSSGSRCRQRHCMPGPYTARSPKSNDRTIRKGMNATTGKTCRHKSCKIFPFKPEDRTGRMNGL
ncbi:MAG: SOS response-associated peptidase family protein [Williamsia sp.]|nr:SOS response-associated peptidase family protein [Williamsia sp.]